MATVFNPIASLTALKFYLKLKDLNEFKSLKQVIRFRKSYSFLREEIIKEHENLLEQEKIILPEKMLDLDSIIENIGLDKRRELDENIYNLKQQLSVSTENIRTNYYQKLKAIVIKWILEQKIIYKTIIANYKVKRIVNRSVKLRKKKYKRLQFILTNFEKAVKQSCCFPLAEIERKKELLDRATTIIYEALSEHKVAREIQKLPDNYILVNDFSINFYPYLYCKQHDCYIGSIQIDHILITPAGIFLIETKNWSEKSLNDSNLRSTVQQILESNYALFRILNGGVIGYNLELDKHRWGSDKLSIKNLLVFINHKPLKEFQYVKILTLNELLSYIRHFEPVLSDSEIQSIAQYLVKINKLSVRENSD